MKMNDTEIDQYMNAFDQLEAGLKALADEHTASNKIPKQEFGQRLARYANIQKLLIAQNKTMLEQMRRMNNIFTSQNSDPVDAGN